MLFETLVAKLISHVLGHLCSHTNIDHGDNGTAKAPVILAL